MHQTFILYSKMKFRKRFQLNLENERIRVREKVLIGVFGISE